MVTPAEAAKTLRMSRGAISKCVALGAPVHRWGPTGYRYRIDLEEFTAWMDAHGRECQSRAAGAGSPLPFRAAGGNWAADLKAAVM